MLCLWVQHGGFVIRGAIIAVIALVFYTLFVNVLRRWSPTRWRLVSTVLQLCNQQRKTYLSVWSLALPLKLKTNDVQINP